MTIYLIMANHLDMAITITVSFFSTIKNLKGGREPPAVPEAGADSGEDRDCSKKGKTCSRVGEVGRPGCTGHNAKWPATQFPHSSNPGVFSSPGGSNEFSSDKDLASIYTRLAGERYCEGDEGACSPILLSSVFSSQKDRKQTSCLRFVSPKQDATHSQVQNGDSGPNSQINSKGTLGDVAGHSGRLPKCPNSPSISQVFRLCTGEKDICFPGSPLRTIDRSVGLFQGYQAHKSPSASNGGASFCVSGRLSFPSSHSTISHSSYPVGDGFVGESRIQNKYGQVISVSPAKSGISGGNFRSGEPITIPSNGEDRKNSIFLPSKTAGYFCFKEGIRETGGISQLRGKLPAIGKTLFDSHYGMVEYQHLHEVQGSSSLARPTIKGRSDSLDRARVSEIPGSHAPGSSLNPDYDRCVRRGLGGSIASSPSLGNLESGGKALFNELEGVESRVSHSDIFPRPSEGQICQGAFRQLHHGGLPEKAGFSGIPITLGTHKRHLSNVRGLEHFTVSPPPKRSSQRSGRQTVEKFNHSHGVESRQSNVLKALCHTGSTSSGSVRHKEQYPAPCVHFPLSRSGSSGLRCTQSGLGKLEVNIRLSPNSDLARGRLEVEHVHRDRVPDCPFLANRQLVPVAFGEVPSQLPSSSAPLAITDNIVRTSMVQSGGVFKPSRM